MGPSRPRPRFQAYLIAGAGTPGPAHRVLTLFPSLLLALGLHGFMPKIAAPASSKARCAFFLYKECAHFYMYMKFFLFQSRIFYPNFFFRQVTTFLEVRR